VVLGSAAVALEPGRRTDGPEPLGGDDGEAVERMPHGLGGEVHPVERANCSQHMRGGRPLPAARFQQLTLAAPGEQRVEKARFCPTGEQSGAELAQDRRIESGIAQLQPEHVFPVDPTPDSVGRPAIGKARGRLEEGHQRQAPGREGGWPMAREERCEGVIGEQGAEFVSQAQIRVAFREGGLRDAYRLWRDGGESRPAEHGRPPQGAAREDQRAGNLPQSCPLRQQYQVRARAKKSGAVQSKHGKRSGPPA
jgi:hypothetical protein